MLFRTVYGAELAAIYTYIQQHTQKSGSIPSSMIYKSFVASQMESLDENHHVDDALSFLTSALLIQIKDDRVESLTNVTDFRLALLQNLRYLEIHGVEAGHPLDPYYMYLLDEIFIKTGRQYVQDLHVEVNRLQVIQAVGGVSREKVSAWKRVMTSLGIGYRVSNGFLCLYSPGLLKSIIDIWEDESDTLQGFLEKHVEKYIPTFSRIGDLTPSLQSTLQHLSSEKVIDLYQLQDSPSRAFFDTRQYKGIRKRITHV